MDEGPSQEQVMEGLNDMAGTFMNLWAERAAADPAGKNDLITMLAHGDETRDMVTRPLEFLGNIMLLIVGGNDTTRNSISGGVLALNQFPREYDKLRCDPLPAPPSVLTFSLVSAEPTSPPARDAWEAWFDADAVRFPLTVRTRRPGDRIWPLGGRGSRKVQDALVDAKVPRAQRDALPLVVQGEEVIWIPGVLRGATAPIDGTTTRVLRMGREPL